MMAKTLCAGRSKLLTFLLTFWGKFQIQVSDESMQIVRMDTEDLCSLRVIALGSMECIKHEPALRLFHRLVIFGNLNAFDRLSLQ